MAVDLTVPAAGAAAASAQGGSSAAQQPGAPTLPLSRKARHRGKTQWRLHEVLKAPSVVDAKQLHKVAHGKGDLWDVATAPPPAEQWRPAAAAAAAASSPASESAALAAKPEEPAPWHQRWRPHPAAELLRVSEMTFLRKQLSEMCHGSQATAPPLLAFERWLCRCQMRAAEEAPPSPESRVEPLLPADGAWRDPVFSTELQRVSIAAAAAGQVVARMAALAAASAAKVRSVEEGAPASVGEVQVVRHKHTMDVLLEPASLLCPPKKQQQQKQQQKQQQQKQAAGAATLPVALRPVLRDKPKIFKLNPAHDAKLRSLFRRNYHGGHDGGDGGGGGGASNTGGAVFDEPVFDEALYRRFLYCVLARYHALLGHGFQAALGGRAFEVLLRRLEVRFECFASPLNCRYSSFCSVFPDVDWVFGSVGSFFDDASFRPRTGSFEANPPFVAELMQAMARRIDELLGASDEPLSFTVIVPGWTETPAWETLSGSAHRRAVWCIAKDDHGFCSGAQHQDRDRYRTSPFDTAIFVLQNAAGAARWPATADVEAEVRLAMADAVPTEQAKERRARLGKGAGDEDGGGGVYRGAKRKRTGDGVRARKDKEDGVVVPKTPKVYAKPKKKDGKKKK